MLSLLPFVTNAHFDLYPVYQISFKFAQSSSHIEHPIHVSSVIYATVDWTPFNQFNYVPWGKKGFSTRKDVVRLVISP
jgi:hypothetical protein